MTRPNRLNTCVYKVDQMPMTLSCLFFCRSRYQKLGVTWLHTAHTVWMIDVSEKHPEALYVIARTLASHSSHMAGLHQQAIGRFCCAGITAIYRKAELDINEESYTEPGLMVSS